MCGLLVLTFMLIAWCTETTKARWMPMLNLKRMVNAQQPIMTKVKPFSKEKNGVPSFGNTQRL